MTVLARIRSRDFYRQWTETEREACRQWLEANSINPWNTSIGIDVEIVVLDCPAIEFTEFELDEDGRVRCNDEGPITNRRSVLLRVQLPDPPTFPVETTR